MPKFPEPPSATRLATTPPGIYVLLAGTRLWRLYFRGGPHPTSWSTFRAYGPARSRFDHHLPPSCSQARKILYAASEGPVCLAEIFQDTRVFDRIAWDPWLVGFEVTRDVPLLDLTGIWPTLAGASMAISTGARPRAQRWSRTIYEAYPEVQGLYYPASMYGNRPAVALYERAADAIPAAPIFHRSLNDPALLAMLKKVAREIGYGLV